VKKVLLIVAVFMVFLPVVSIAQSIDNEACTQAEVDAGVDFNKQIWWAGGCLFGLIAVGVAYVVKPNPPASRLVGKSPEYVASYTDCYEDKAGSLQRTAALQGCLVGFSITMIIYNIALLGD
jgi:hypothetical protein